MTQEEAKQRIAVLKRLREERQETVAQAQARLKSQKAVRRQVCQAMRDAPKTVPEVAETTGIPADQVLWHLTAMKKYDQAVETGMCGEYYLYRVAKESSK